jgi:cobalt/nickel transport system permease protein
MAFIGLTTPMTEIFKVLEDFKFPKVMLEISMLMYRYIFVSLDEAVTMYHSQETRLGYSSLKKSYKSMGILIANIFIKTWITGEKSFVSMQSRGYDGSIRTMNDLKSIRTVGIRNLMLLIILEVMLSVGVYFTATFRIF